MLSGTQRRSPISRHRRSNGTGVGRFHLVAERHAASAASDDLAGAPSAPPPGPGTMSGSRAGALTPACAARPCAVCGAPVQAGHRGRFHLADVPAHTPGRLDLHVRNRRQDLQRVGAGCLGDRPAADAWEGVAWECTAATASRSDQRERSCSFAVAGEGRVTG